MAKKRMEYVASIAVLPGDSLKELIGNLGMTQVELAIRTGISKKHINEIVKGIAPISQETSLKLESVLGLPASFWNNLENNYRETLARINAQEDICKEEQIAREIPYPEIAKLGWVIPTRIIGEKVVNLRRFFGLASLNLIPDIYDCRLAFRRSEQFSASDYALATWLRQGEIKSKELETEVFNKARLKRLIPEFRKLTRLKPNEFYPKMVDLCASCGIALILVPHIPKTHVCGATKWAKNNKVTIQLSVRGARADIFWFTFFHEIAHILLHDNKELHLQNNEKRDNPIEDEADKQARDWLIPTEDYARFISRGNYADRRSIVSFAEQITIHPSIVVGRLCKENRISYASHNDLRPSFKIVSKDKEQHI